MNRMANSNGQICPDIFLYDIALDLSNITRYIAEIGIVLFVAQLI